MAHSSREWSTLCLFLLETWTGNIPPWPPRPGGSDKLHSPLARQLTTRLCGHVNTLRKSVHDLMGQGERVSRCGPSLNINTASYLCSVFFPRSSSLHRHYVMNPQSIAVRCMAHIPLLPVFLWWKLESQRWNPAPCSQSTPYRENTPNPAGRVFRLTRCFLGGIWEGVAVCLHSHFQCLSLRFKLSIFKHI